MFHTEPALTIAGTPFIEKTSSSDSSYTDESTENSLKMDEESRQSWCISVDLKSHLDFYKRENKKQYLSFMETASKSDYYGEAIKLEIKRWKSETIAYLKEMDNIYYNLCHSMMTDLGAAVNDYVCFCSFLSLVKSSV